MSTPSSQKSPADIRAQVQQAYGRIAAQSSGCCAPSAGADTAPLESQQKRQHAQGLGYSLQDVATVTEDANLALGCGNPGALAALRPGEVVLDLGAGAGFDAFLAAQKVGPSGRVVGVDMTPQMLERARTNAVKMKLADRVEFREGTIEALPVQDASVDVIMSNCVINLSPDKAQVFREAYRVLKPGGRLSISDIVLSAPLPEDVLGLAQAYVACVAGAMVEADYVAAIQQAGFVDIAFSRKPAAALLNPEDPLVQQAVAQLPDGKNRLEALMQGVWSYQVNARKAA